LAFQNSIYPPRFLLGAQLAVVVGFPPSAELSAFAMMAWGISPAFERTFWRKAALTLQK
jgi:hypothetical protein